MDKMRSIVWFREIGKEDVGLVGGKGASLGEMTNHNFPIPPGFIVTAQAYFNWLKESEIRKEVLRKIDAIDVENTEQLEQVSKEVRELILKTTIGEELAIEIKKAYAKLGEKRLGLGSLTSSEEEYVAIRSSATAEDLPEASFAGQQETFLNVIGKNEVVETVKKCWASLFTARAVYYRKKQNFPTEKVGIAAVVQKMVNSDIAGVMFTAEPTGDESKIIIEAAFGLGELVVGGSITPDHYVVDKGKMKIVEKRIAQQEYKIARAGRGNKTVQLPEKIGKKQKLADKTIIELAKIGKQIENHYKFPQDIEWATEGKNLYIVQSRAITTLALGKKTRKEIEAEIIVKGLPASPGSASGEVKVVPGIAEIDNVKEGEVLVTKMTSPDWVPIMKKSAGIVTDAGGLTCHAAIVSRELGIPCIVGTGEGTELLKDGEIVTVDGSLGNVYRGKVVIEEREEEKVEEVVKGEEVERLESTLKEAIVKEEPPAEAGLAGMAEQIRAEEAAEKEVKEKATQIVEEFGNKEYEEMPEEEKKEEREMLVDFLRQVAVKVKVNVALPEAAEEAAKTGAEGVGLLRAEHMITAAGEHPAEFIRKGEQEKLVEAVKSGVRKVASRFKGNPVWYRTFDARTDEFRNLEGGDKEPKEDNPMLGWHGIRRDLDEPELLKAQFRAIKELMGEGFGNIGIMLPFVQSVKELKKAKEIARAVGLEPDSKGLEFGVMIETPAAVWSIDEFIEEGIDFISFGTNDLTQLTLGIDRNNEAIQKLFTELHPAILRQLEYVIKKCKRAGVKSSICGQAASNPEMVKQLVRFGIDSVSANIDAVKKIKNVVLIGEKKLILEQRKKK